MERNLGELARANLDLLIVGGGVFGCCAAWDAALRGLSVALIERGDFAHATSANPFKMVHGGIRYLQHLDLPRIRQSSRERRALLRLAPHLVEPQPILIPTYGHGLDGRPALWMGLKLYDLLVADRNRGIEDPARRIPAGRTVSRDRILELFPGVKRDGLTGGAVFYDAQMYSPSRLALSFLRSACRKGALAANYMEAVGFLREKDRVVGARARDLLSGAELDVRARCVLNATGPWADPLLRRSLGIGIHPTPTFSRDAAFVVKRELNDTYGVAIRGQTRDPDAVVGRSARHLFLVPWRGYTLVGVWHQVHRSGPDDFTVTDRELESFIEEVNAGYPGLELSIDEVSMWNAGLVLFGENEPGAEDLRYGHRSRLVDHASTDSIPGLVSLVGVRYTTARSEARRAVDLVVKKSGKNAPAPNGPDVPLFGGGIVRYREFERRALDRDGHVLPAARLRPVLRKYGTEYGRIVEYAVEDPTLAEPVATSDVTAAEVVHAVREEAAVRLGDVVLRRTELATAEHPGEAAVHRCGELMAAELGWGSERLEQEVADVLNFLNRRTPAGDRTAASAPGRTSASAG